MPQRIGLSEAARILAGMEPGRMMRVCFIKRSDGSERWMTCQRGVRKHLAGGERAYDPNEHRLVSVWDCEAKGYRSIPCEGVREIHADGEIYIVAGGRESAA